MTIKILVHAFNTRMVCLTLLSSMFAAAPVIAADEPATKDAEQAHNQEFPEPNLAFMPDIDCELQSSVIACRHGEKTRNSS